MSKTSRVYMQVAMYVIVLCISLCTVSHAAEPKKDKLDPQCKKEEQAEMKKCSQWTDKAKKTECEKAAKRDAFEVLVLKNTGKKLTDTTDLSTQAKEGHYCVQEEKISARYGKKCGECKKGVAVISRSVASGMKCNKVCNDTESGYRVFCRDEQEESCKKKEEEEKGGAKKETPKAEKYPSYEPKKGEEKRRGLSSDEQSERVGKTYAVVASHYDSCGSDSLNPCTRTSSGRAYEPESYTVAHKDLRLGTEVEICNQSGTCRAAVVDNRGPYTPGRDVDLSQRLARELGSLEQGVARMTLRVVSNPPDAVAYKYYPKDYSFQMSSLSR